jgi:hypothetical protein
MAVGGCIGWLVPHLYRRKGAPATPVPALAAVQPAG